MTPIDTMLAAVEWSPIDPPTSGFGTGSLPHATHSGVMDVFGKSMRCYRLSDGTAVFDADDFVAFVEGMA